MLRENVLLNASATTITGFNESEDSGNLTFSWKCPTNESAPICTSAGSSSTLIIYYY